MGILFIREGQDFPLDRASMVARLMMMVGKRVNGQVYFEARDATDAAERSKIPTAGKTQQVKQFLWREIASRCFRLRPFIWTAI